MNTATKKKNNNNNLTNIYYYNKTTSVKLGCDIIVLSLVVTRILFLQSFIHVLVPLKFLLKCH